MRAVDNAEHVVSADKTESRPCTLQVIDRLAHITLGTEYQGSDTVLRVFNLLRLADLFQALDNLPIGQPGVSKDSTSRLDGFDDLIGLVASERESGSRGVDFHSPSQRLLSTRCHTR